MELPGVHYISGFAQPRYVWRGDVTVSFAPNSMAWEGSASSLMENSGGGEGSPGPLRSNYS